MSTASKIALLGEANLLKNCLQLPRLPVPPLAQTVDRYSQSLRALKKPYKVDPHLTKLDAFFKSSAPALHQRLVDRDRVHAERKSYPHSYIESIWDDSYLMYRGPSPVNIAPAFAMRPTKAPGSASQRPQCEAAAAVVHRALRFVEKILTNQLDVSTEQPMGVSQLAIQFGFSRIPHPTRDSLVRFGLMDGSRHIIAMRRGYLYQVRIRDDHCDAYSEETIAAALKHVIEDAGARPENAFPIGALTGSGRSDWAASYDHLLTLKGENAAMMAAIQQAFIVVCLDESDWSLAPSERSSHHRPSHARLMSGMLVGASKADRSNRWYDKHQIIVDAKGTVAGNFEHAFSDGLTWSRWMNEVYCDMAGVPSGQSPLPTLPAGTAPSSAADLVSFLDFGVTVASPVDKCIKTALHSLGKTVESVSLDSVVLDVGRKGFKDLKFSGDAFCQLAFHMAYMRMHSKIAPTYESCSTAGFWHGRTETIRSASIEMHHFLLDDSALLCGSHAHDLSSENKATLRAAAQLAAKRHVQLAQEAKMGQGVDRHMLALKEITKEAQDPAGLSFFNDRMYEYSGTWMMSTSNVTQPFMDYFNFGPVTGDGYGLGYNVLEDEVHIGVSSLTTSNRARATELSGAIKRAGEDLLAVLRST